MGNYKESLEHLRKAYAQSDNLTPEAAAEIAAHLGEVLWVIGNKDEAKAVFEKALKDFPENEKLKEAVKKFLP
ncbi:MAG: tetratricopeptide repeat protein [Desulfobacteraceae bacterium]|nr:tetratricopeptide repeat protein [Desulfobacteraceae bacterium]